MRQVEADKTDRTKLALFQLNKLMLSSLTVKEMQQANIFALSLLREIIIFFIIDIMTCFSSFCKYANLIISFTYFKIIY